MKSNKKNNSERAHRLHKEIVENISNVEFVKCYVEELYEITKENLENEYDLILLYQIFDLLQEEEKQKHCEELLREHFTKRLSYLQNQSIEEFTQEFDPNRCMFPNSTELLAHVDTFSKEEKNTFYNNFKNQDEQDYEKWITAPMKEIVESHLPEYRNTSNEFIVSALYEYCFLPQEEFDEIIDQKIVYLAQAYFSHNRYPRDLFHADHSYICDRIALDLEKSELLQRFSESPFEYNCIMLEMPGYYTGNVKYKTRAKRLLYGVGLRYTLRGFYPKKQLSSEKHTQYLVSKILFDRTLFNISMKESQNNLFSTYYEPEELIGSYLKKILPERDLKKSEWICLYFASKEIEMDRFQSLFLVKDKRKIALESVMMDKFAESVLGHPLIGEQFKKHFDNVEYLQFYHTHKQIPNSLTSHHKTFIKGLLFCAMWEKSQIRHINQKTIDELSTQSQENKDFDEVMREVEEYRFQDEINKLFAEKSVEELGDVLKEVSKRIGMSDEGFDYSGFDLDGEISDPSDLITLLFNFSRIERESTPYLINFLNLLRERQKNIMGIEDKIEKYNENGSKKYTKQYNKENHNRLKAIDVGFPIKNFQVTMRPLTYIQMLKNSDVNNQYMYINKVVKFVCETDMEYNKDASEKDLLEFYKNSLDTTYLYKIRNQHTHFSLDQNIEKLMKDPRKLLLVLIEGYNKYQTLGEVLLHDWEKQGLLKRMMRERPYRAIPILYVIQHLAKTLQFLSIIISVKNEDKFSPEELEIMRFNFHEDNATNAIPKLKFFLEENTKKEKYTVDFPGFTDEEIEKIMKIYFELQKHLGTDKDALFHQASTFTSYISVIKDIVESLLNFLFSTHTQNYLERTQLNSFFTDYHRESALYMLYLAQHFCNGLNKIES